MHCSIFFDILLTLTRKTVLLDAGFTDEAYARYAVEAAYATNNLATFKAIVKEYPHVPRETIWRDLVASQPGEKGSGSPQPRTLSSST